MFFPDFHKISYACSTFCYLPIKMQLKYLGNHVISEIASELSMCYEYLGFIKTKSCWSA